MCLLGHLDDVKVSVHETAGKAGEAVSGPNVVMHLHLGSITGTADYGLVFALPSHCRRP